MHVYTAHAYILRSGDRSSGIDTAVAKAAAAAAAATTAVVERIDGRST